MTVRSITWYNLKTIEIVIVSFNMAYLRGWRYNLMIGGLLGALAVTLYPIILDPMINTDKYSKYDHTLTLEII